METLIARGINTVNYDDYKTHDAKNPFEPIKKKVEETAPHSAQFAFYLASMLYHSSMIEHLITEGSAVVRSRYIDDVVAHHAHLEVPYVQQIAKLFPILQPDLRVVLMLPEEVRRQRVFYRGEINTRDKDTKVAGSRADFFERFLIHTAHKFLDSGKALIVDTSIRSPHEVVECIVDHLVTIQAL